MKKILTVVGARPQFIKAAAISRVIKKTPGLREIIVHTGQHFDFNMSDVFFEELEISTPEYNLEVNEITHGAMTGKILQKLEPVLVKEKPDVLLVYGDTNSTLAGALCAAKLNIPVAHVEAGLRSGNMQMPEEINRILTDRVSSYLFCPSSDAVNNLKKEGFQYFDCKIYQTGDVMYDALLHGIKIAEKRSGIIQKLRLHHKEYILCTIHRQENTNAFALKSIVSALNTLQSDYKIIFPMHPRTRKIILENQLKTRFDMIDPLGYHDMLVLLRNCILVITDSGGLQKEAYWMNKYCITVREQTEWMELVENEYNILTGTQQEDMIGWTKKLAGKIVKNPVPFYGDGNAASKIIQYLTEVN